MTEEMIFELTLALPIDNRQTLLDRMCVNDQSMRRRLEERLSAEFQTMAQELPPTVDSDNSANGSIGNPSSTAVDRVGGVIGPYKLIQKFGEGGMGTVWLAEQEKPVKRRVALKLIKSGMDSAQVIRRFAAERQMLALMEHEHIAKVLDAGATSDGRPYFVMDLVKGIPITKYCDEVRASIADRLHLFLQACSAVQHAHQKGVIHRDLKPSNILVGVQDDKPFTKVIDFGVAKSLTQNLDDYTAVTQYGQIVGTLEYMAPEQTAISALDIDTRADIYALGVLLFELLTGSTPITRLRLKKAAIAEVLRIIKEEEVPRPSLRLAESKETLVDLAAKRRIDPKKLANSLRSELDWIALKALDKDRTRRYATANGLARDIERYLADEPIEARAPTTGARLNKFVKKNRALVVAAAVVLTSLLFGIVGTTEAMNRARRAEGIALAEAAESERANRREAEQRQLADESAAAARISETLAKREAATATAVKNFLQRDLLRLADAQHQADENLRLDPDLKVRDLLERAAGGIEGKFPDQPLVEAELRLCIAGALTGVGKSELALSNIQQATRLARKHLGTAHDLTQSAIEEESRAQFYAKHFQETLRLCTELLEIRRATRGPNDPATLWAMNRAANALVDVRRLDDAVRLFEETLKLQSTHLGPEHWQTASTSFGYSNALFFLGRHEEALKIRQAVLDGYRKRLAPDHPGVLSVARAVASSLERVGRIEDAAKLQREIVARQKPALGLSHPETIESTRDLARLLQRLGRISDAVVPQSEAHAMTAARFGADHIDTMNAAHQLAYFSMKLGRHVEALKINEENWQRRKAKLGADHSDTRWSLYDISLSLDVLGRSEESAKRRQELRILPNGHGTLIAAMNDAVKIGDYSPTSNGLPGFWPMTRAPMPNFSTTRRLHRHMHVD